MTKVRSIGGRRWPHPQPLSIGDGEGSATARGRNLVLQESRLQSAVPEPAGAPTPGNGTGSGFVRYLNSFEVQPLGLWLGDQAQAEAPLWRGDGVAVVDPGDEAERAGWGGRGS